MGVRKDRGNLPGLAWCGVISPCPKSPWCQTPHSQVVSDPTCTRELSEWPWTGAYGIRGPERRWRSCVQLRARNRVRMNERNGVRTCARSRVRRRARNRVRMRARNRVRLGARNRVRMPARNRLRTCARSRVLFNERSRVRVSVRRMWSWRMIYHVGALAPKIVTRCGASPSVLLSRLHVVCVIETPHVLKQGVYKLHCWFAEPDANLLLTW